MGLFDRFQPGIYSSQLAQMGAPETIQGPTALPAMQPQATPTIQKRPGLFARWSAPDDTGISKFDRIGLIGASLRDDPNVAPAVMEQLQGQQKLMLARQQAVAKQAAQAQLASLFGGGQPSPGGAVGGQPMAGAAGAPAAGATPSAAATMPSISDPATIQKLLALQAAGVDIGPTLDILKANKAPDPQIAFSPDGQAINAHDAANVGRHFANPTNVNNTVVDLNDPNNLNRVVPSAPVNGAMPVYDNLGKVVDWTMPKGAVGAIGAAAGATEGAKAGLDVIDVPLADGRTVKMSRADYLAQLHGGSQMPGLGVAPSSGDKVYAEAQAKDAADQYKGFVAAGTQAPAKIAKYRQIEQLLGNFDGGKLSPTGLDIASAANSLGFKMDPKWSNAQAADALSSQLTLELSGGSLGTGFSNADRDFMIKQVPGIAQSSGARKTLIDIGVAKAQREQEVASFARKWVQRGGRLDTADRSGKTFYDYMDEYASAHPLWAK